MFDKRNVTQDEVIRNIFQQRGELLDQLERSAPKYGQCVECGLYFDKPEALHKTSRGYYNDGPALCAMCKAERDRRLSKKGA